MTQEDKQLLLKDLCARLPYKIMVKVNDTQGIMDEIDIPNERIFVSSLNPFLYGGAKAHWFTVDGDKIYPYLRPMSGMTEEERIEYESFFFSINDNEWPDTICEDNMANLTDWLSKKMFDYRKKDGKTMIEAGLALEAPEGMYK